MAFEKIGTLTKGENGSIAINGGIPMKIVLPKSLGKLTKNQELPVLTEYIAYDGTTKTESIELRPIGKVRKSTKGDSLNVFLFDGRVMLNVPCDEVKDVLADKAPSATVLAPQDDAATQSKGFDLNDYI